MLLSLNWLQEFVPFQGDVEELSHRLTMAGLEVEEILTPFAYLQSVVVGKIVECKPHPQSDHLSLCKVDVGKEILPIVCGAPNVGQGQHVPVALLGSKLPSGLVIKKAKLRGEVSIGMICSQKELELGSDTSGIWVLDQEKDLSLSVGQDLITALNLDKYVLDIGITPNRADCLSVLGLAREVAVLYDLPLTLPKFELKEEDPVLDYEVEVEAKEDCFLYQARLITGCQIKPSPYWMRAKLIASGVNPVNNVVDVTNYVLFELGQPLHSFDRSLLAGNKIKVARAQKEMSFVTLDGKERKLVPSDLLIWDQEKPVALAGVMGGANSEISDNSSEVLLECAVFNPITIRKTARRLGLGSESSYRFERGIDQGLAPFALDRAASLIQILSEGKVLTGVAKQEPRPWPKRLISFRPEKVSKLLGISIPAEFSKQTLQKLGCKVQEQGPWQVEVPSFRHDLSREVDLIEEVGRIYGLDRIESRLPKVSKSLDIQPERLVDFLNQVKTWARSAGLNETINYSFVGNKELDLLGLPAEERVYVLNPLSEEQNVLRTSLLPGMLGSVRVNVSRENKSLSLFEVAKVFFYDSEQETLCREENRLGIVLVGRRYPEKWPFPQEEVFDYVDLKGLVESFATFLGLKDLSFSKCDHPFLNPGVKIINQDQEIGCLGLVLEHIAKFYEVKENNIWYAELNLDQLLAFWPKKIGFKELPKFPAVKRDITVVCPLDLELGKIFEEITAYPANILENVYLKDVYYPQDKAEKNVTLRLIYRSKEKTLKDKEVDKLNQKIAQTVVEKLNLRFP